MKQLNRKKKAIQLVLSLAVISLIGPYLLCKCDFYGTSHAMTPTSPSSNTSATLIAASSNTPTSIESKTTDSNPPLTNNANLGPYSYADAVALAAPSVVTINTTTEIPMEMNPLMQDPFFRHFFGEQFGIDSEPSDIESGPGAKGEIPKAIRKGLGSGVIVSDKGYILTNNHVVRNSSTVSVKLADGRSSEAKVIGSDPDSDLAVLKIDLDKLPVIPIGSSKKIRVGDVVLAIGSAFGFENTVTQGIVSATGRSGEQQIAYLDNLIQTDAAINFGNSGGALIDARGQLIGINTAMYSRTGSYQGIGFAIPIDQAMEVLKVLIEGGHITRGYLGVSMQGLTKEIREIVNYKEGDGILVRATVRGGPAQKAGMLPGDVITKINNTVVKDERQALKLVASLSPGKSYPVEVFRKGEFMNFMVVPVDRAEVQKQAAEKAEKQSRSEKRK